MAERDRTVIIAEAGVNHNGDIGIAMKMVDCAASAGADYVKFQTFKADNLASASAKKAEYQKATTDSAESQLEMLQRLELTPDMHRRLIKRCDEAGIAFLSSAFD
jgi:sialic acid synthase SpsE